MIFRRLIISISIRIVLLAINITAIVYFWMGNRDLLILLNLLVLMFLQVYLFIRSQNQVNRKIRAFLDAFKFDDLGFTTGDGFKDKSFRDLYSAMHGILDHVQQVDLENERQKQYFQSVTEHAGVGILAFNAKQEVRLANGTLKDLLGIVNLSDLSDLDSVREGLSQQLEQINPGEQKLIRLDVQNPADILGETRMQLSVRSVEIKLEEEKIFILDDSRKEMHELMGNVETPLSQLALDTLHPGKEELHKLLQRYR